MIFIVEEVAIIVMATTISIAWFIIVVIVKAVIAVIITIDHNYSKICSNFISSKNFTIFTINCYR